MDLDRLNEILRHIPMYFKLEEVGPLGLLISCHREVNGQIYAIQRWSILRNDLQETLEALDLSCQVMAAHLKRDTMVLENDQRTLDKDLRGLGE